MISLLKKLNDSCPEFIKIIMGPIIRRKLINNRVFKKQLEEIRVFNGLSKEERNKVIEKKKTELLLEAYQEVPYYKQKWNEIGLDYSKIKKGIDLNQLPLINKQNVIENFSEFQNIKYSNFYSNYTGGSTGQALQVNLDKDSIYMERAFVYAFWEQHGYDIKKSRVGTFRSVAYPKGKYYKYNPLYNELLLDPNSLTSKNIEGYVKLLEKMGVEFLTGYPSGIANFCKLIVQKDIKIKNIRGVFTSSENFTKEEYKIVQNALNCPCVQIYGHTERSVFAEGVGVGAYKFNDLYGLHHLKADGTIVVTGFINRRMPLINYETDDIAYQNLDKTFFIQGHKTEQVMIGKNDAILTVGLDFHSQVFAKITSYQFVQNIPGEAELLLETEFTLSEDEKKEVIGVVYSAYRNNIDITCKFVKKIEVTKSGKHKKLVQNIKY